MPDNFWNKSSPPDPPEDDPPHTGDTPEAPDDNPYPDHVEVDGVVPLGHNRGVFYYYSRMGKQVIGLTAAHHNRSHLTALASVAYFWQRGRFCGDKGNVLWDQAIDWMMQMCREIGIYNPDRVRGRGAWLDDGRAVLHVGNRLIVDGESSPLWLPRSTNVYEAAQSLPTRYAPALTTAEAHKLFTICDSLSWRVPFSGRLLAGFCVVAPICGALAWRPSIWLTGGSGSGKSWLVTNFLNPMMAGMALFVQSKTSEAGIRQTLGSDALPVLFDEAEAEDANAAQRMQGVLDLLRQSSSEGGAKIVKGSATGGAKHYRIRSCFALSSINVGIVHQADESRISVLALRERDPARAAENEGKLREVIALTQATITPEFAAGMLSRTVALLPIIRANAEIFARAVSVVLGSRRAGDQLGTLLAGAYTLCSDKAITEEAAEAWVRKQDWGSAAESEIERDEVRLLSYLTQHQVRVGMEKGAAEVTIGRLIEATLPSGLGTAERIPREVAELELKQIGIKRATRDGQEGCWVSNSHPALRRLLKDTPWSGGWRLALGRLPGAVTGERTTIRFALGHTAKSTWLPIEAFQGDDPGV